MRVLLDTCSLLYWTLDQERLSRKARQLIMNSETIAISSISIWEIGIKTKRNKLVLPLSFKDYVTGLQSVRDFIIIPVDAHIWIKNISLEWEHNDPADRTIIATALLNDVKLVTSDKVMLDFYPGAVW